MDAVNDLLFILGFMRKLSTVAFANILTAGAKPDCLLSEIFDLLIREVADVKVMQSPHLIVFLIGHPEIAETQARLRPPEVALRAMNVLQHDGLIKFLKQIAAIASMTP